MFFCKIWSQLRKPVAAAESDIGSSNGKRIDYIKLEDRRVLNATFAFDLMTGQLTLDNFTDDFAGANQVNISQSNDQYLFTLSDGIWTSIGGVGSPGDGSNVLAIDIALVSTIDVISNTADQFGIEFSNFAFVGDVNIFQEAGFEVFSSVTQVLGTQLSQIGALNIEGVQSIELQNATNDFDVVDISNVSEARLTDATSLIVGGAAVETTLSIHADGIFVDGEIGGNDILLNSSAGISQMPVGRIIAANLLLAGTGSFELDVSMNEVENLAASVDGSLSYANNGDIQFASLAVDGFQIDGVSISDDLEIDSSIANGFISQSAAVQVSGIARFDVGTGDICLTGGDFNVENDFNTLRIVTATNAEIVDANDFTVLSANVTNQLWLAAGDTDLDLTDGIGGTLTLAGDVTVGNQVLLQASSGVQQLAGVIDTTQLLLGGDEAKEGNGIFDLRLNNSVRELAAQLDGELSFATSADLSIVNAVFDSVCDDPIANPNSEAFVGILSNDGPVKLQVGNDLSINAQLNVGSSNVVLLADGHLSQSGSGVITAGGLGLMVSGSTVLNGANNVTTLAADNGGTTIFNDVNSLNIGTVSIAVGTDPVMVVSGISTINSDLKIAAHGSVLVDRAIALGAGVAFFDINGNLNQSVAGTISANGLGLMVGGSTLLGANNDVNVFAADNDGLIVYRDVDGLNVGSVSVAAGTAFGMSLAGLTTSNDDTKLIVGGNLTLNQLIDTESGTTFLAVGGNLSQAAAGTITANGLGLMVNGSTLLGANNDVNVIAADNGGLIVYRDVDGLAVGTISVAAGTAFEMSVSGISTSNDDAKLIVGGNLTLNQLIDTESGTTFLAVGGNLSQAAAGTITANGLGLMVNGSTLLGANNDVNVIAADNEGLSVFRDVDGLNVGSVSVAAGTAFGMSLAGLTTSNDDAKLIVGGNLTLNQVIDIGSGTTILAVGGNLSQAVAGTIAANGLGLMVGGSTLLGANNDVNVIAADNGGLIVYRDVDGLAVGTISVAAGTAFEMSVSGISTSNDDAKLIVGGNLTLNQVIDIGSGTAILAVGGNLSQAVAGTIAANGLGLMVGGSTLLGANNDVNVIAADNGGLIVYHDVDGLAVGTISVAAGTAFEMSVSGISTSNDDAKLIVGGNLTLNQVIDIGSGTTFLAVGGNLSQAAAGTITANGLGLMVNGSTLLSANNDVNVIAADNEGLSVFRDVDDLLVGTITIAMGSAFEMMVAGITTSSDDTKLIVDGNLVISNRMAVGSAHVLLDVAGNVSQTQLGTITGGGLALMVDGSTSLLNLANSIDRFAADNIGSTSLRNDTDLTISRIIVEGMEIDGVTLRNQFFADINGSIRQSAGIVVNGTTNLLASGDICLSGADSTGDGLNDNDFIGVVTAAASGSSLEISDSNQLTVSSLFATEMIRLRSGDGANGSLVLTNSIVTSAAGGQVLLQSDRGVSQSIGNSIIDTDSLLLGSASISDARRGDFDLLGNNVVKNVAGELDSTLDFTNRRDLNIAPLSYDSNCTNFVESFRGLRVGSVVLNVTAGDSTLGSLSDSLNAETVIDTVAQLNVAANIVLGDGAATLQFTEHSIDKLVNQNVSDVFLQISAAGNRGNADGSDILATANVSLFVDSTIILSDVNVAGTLFIDTIEATPSNGSAGDILQTMISDDLASTITAESGAFVSNASLQLTNTLFDRLAIEVSQNVSQLIQPFLLNANIGSTFTGSIDANVFADPDADQFVNGGDPANPVDGVFDVEAGFLNDGFFAGNNQFLNPDRVGAVVINGKALDVVSFDALGLSALQLADVENRSSAATSLGDIYLETIAAANLDISANIDVTSGWSNITVVAGGNLELNGNAELRRSEGSDLIGLVNTLQFEFPFDQFLLSDPRSVLAAPGNIAFSDLNAQLDSAIGFQNFEFFFGNSGQTSFNLIVGWFVEGVSASDALNALFQQSLLQGNTDLTADFRLSNFGNFGQGLSAYSLQLDSQLAGVDAALSLTNTSQFQQSFFASRSFLLSQIFLTNDARINVFADGGSTDLNFTQEILPTRTVVQNPNFIVVDTPRFEVPEPPATVLPTPFNFVNLIQNPDSDPIVTEQQPESYFLIKYTADDDGLYEESFKWDDANDDPDAIRAAIEDAQLNDNDAFWPETDGENKGGWFEKIKEGKQVKPGLYFIFEVQDGQEISEPVDAPIDRTDLENLIHPDSDLDFGDSSQSQLDRSLNSGETESNSPNDLFPIDESPKLFSEPLTQAEVGAYRFSDATRSASIGSSLLLAQYLLNRGTSSDRLSHGLSRPVDVAGNLFSRAARFARKLNHSIRNGVD